MEILRRTTWHNSCIALAVQGITGIKRPVSAVTFVSQKGYQLLFYIKHISLLVGFTTEIIWTRENSFTILALHGIRGSQHWVYVDKIMICVKERGTKYPNWPLPVIKIYDSSDSGSRVCPQQRTHLVSESAKRHSHFSWPLFFFLKMRSHRRVFRLRRYKQPCMALLLNIIITVVSSKMSIFKNENRLRGCCLIEWLIHEPTDGECWKCILIIRSQAWFCWKKDNALKKDQSSEIRQANNDCRVTFQGLTTQACLGNISQIELLSHQISVNSEYYWSSQREVTCLLS